MCADAFRLALTTAEDLLLAACSTSLVVFDRDPADGALDLLDTAGVDDGLAIEAMGVAVSPDDRFAYAASALFDEIVVFALPEPGGAGLWAAAGAALVGLARRREREAVRPLVDDRLLRSRSHVGSSGGAAVARSREC